MDFRDLSFLNRLRFIEYYDRELTIEKELNRQTELETKILKDLNITDEEFSELYESYTDDLNLRKKSRGEK